MSFEGRLRRLWLPFFYVMALSVSLMAVGCTPEDAQQDSTSIPATPTAEIGNQQPALTVYASVAITPPDLRRLGRVNVVPSHAILPAGETTLFSAIAYDIQGNTLSPDKVTSRWRMLDTQAGSITPSGVFRAGTQRGVFNNAIEVTISQEVNGNLEELQGLASVSVIRPLTELDISRVQVLPADMQLAPGTQVTLSALALDLDGAPVPEVDYSWEMLVPRAGSISHAGQFTSGATTGSFPAAIRVIARKREDPTQSTSATVSVTIADLNVVQAPSKVNLYPQAVVLRPGDTMEFRALALDPKGNLIKDVQTSWAIRDPVGGELDAQGKFRAGKTPGTYPNLVEVTVTPSVGDSPVSLKATATVTVLKPSEDSQRLGSLLLTPQVARLRPGETVQLTATALSRSGKVVSPAAVNWFVRSDVLSVSPDGEVTAGDKPGVYQDAVTVKVTEREGEQQTTQTASATVIVLGPLDRVEVVPSNAEVSPKQILQFIFLAYDTNGVRLFDVIGSWEVVDKQAGTIDKTGLFIAGQVPGEYKNSIKLTVKLLKLPSENKK